METSKNLPRQITLEELISSQEDSHANPTRSQEKEKEKKTNATCSQRCLELFESVRPVGSWERTFAGLLIGTGDWYSKRCALTWKLVGTPYNRLFFQLAPSTLPTEETEFGLLPTVKTLDSYKQRVLDENGENTSQTTGQKYGIHLTQMAEAGMLPTPTATSDLKGGATRTNPKRQRDTLAYAMHDPELGKTSQLNPRFVEEMMGFPKNWTVSPFQNGEGNQSKHTETP